MAQVSERTALADDIRAGERRVAIRASADVRSSNAALLALRAHDTALAAEKETRS